MIYALPRVPRGKLIAEYLARIPHAGRYGIYRAQ